MDGAQHFSLLPNSGGGRNIGATTEAMGIRNQEKEDTKRDTKENPILGKL